jgi:hypothetical protein
MKSKPLTDAKCRNAKFDEVGETNWSTVAVTCLISSGYFNLGEWPRELRLNNIAAWVRRVR